MLNSLIMATNPSLTLALLETTRGFANTTTFTSGTVVAPSDGLIIAVLLCRGADGGRSISSATVMGSAANVYGPANSGTSYVAGGIATREVTSGSSGTVSIVLDASGGSVPTYCIAIYHLAGNKSAAPVLVTNITQTVNSSSIPLVMNNTRDTLGLYIAYTNSNVGHSWSSATENYDAYSTHRYSHASKLGGTKPHTETAYASDSNFYAFGTLWR